MRIEDVEREALSLSKSERAALVLTLMDTLASGVGGVPDEEVDDRDEQMESGSVQPILHQEFVRRVQEERGR